MGYVLLCCCGFKFKMFILLIKMYQLIDILLLHIKTYNSSIGSITLASDGNALIGLWFDGQKYDRNVLLLEAEEKKLPIFSEAYKWLDIYFSGKKPDFTPPILMRTTDFRKKVWDDDSIW